MRKILFKKWIPVEYSYREKGTFCETKTRIQGTGCYSNDFTEEGLFHQWINSSEEGNVGVIIYPIAIVELKNGEIIELPTNAVKFTDTSLFF